MFKLVWDKEAAAKIGLKLDSDIKAAAELVADEARKLAPVKSGALRDSIRVEPSKFKNGGHLIVAGNDQEDYASFVGLGTKDMPAQPFMRPALHKMESKIRRMIKL